MRVLVANPERQLLVRARAPPHADVEAPVAEDVEHACALGHTDRVIDRERQADDAVSNPNLLSARSDAAENDLWSARVRMRLQAVMLYTVKAVETKLVCERRLIDRRSKDLSLVDTARVRHLPLEYECELQV
jgi:hypothetical protein